MGWHARGAYVRLRHLRRWVVVVSLLACLGFLNSASVHAQSQDPATLRVAVPADIISIDPARITRHTLTEIVHGLLYASLLGIDTQHATYTSGLAESVAALSSTTWQVTLRSDGLGDVAAPQLAADLARYFRRNLLPASSSSEQTLHWPGRNRLAPVRDVRAEGAHLVFELKEPWAALPSVLAVEPAVRLTARGELLPTGPFELERWDNGNRVIVRRREPTPQGGFDRIWFEVIPSAEERLQRLIAGDVHIAMDLPGDAYWRLRRQRGVAPVVVPQSRVHIVELNLRQAPFDDVRVRRALNLAVDMNTLIRTLMQDQAQPVATLVSPAFLAYDPQIAPYPYDPAAARVLLTEAGYPDGFYIELDTTRTRRRIAEIYKSMLAHVGVHVHIREWPNWNSLQRAITLGQRQMWIAEKSARGLDPREILWDSLHRDGTGNRGGLRHPQIDALLEEADRTFDPLARLDVYRRLQSVLHNEAPFIFGYMEYTVYGASTDLVWTPGPNGLLRLDTVRRPIPLTDEQP